MLFKSLNQLFNSSNKSTNITIIKTSTELNESVNLNNEKCSTNKYYNSIFTRPSMYTF
ncbi:hypothetical protein RB653_002226 [Dictyostelium firmibasis]|uniref:Uncharacterized protein n=1 Tax=Dictyostelium firmibasis TaxID=79012 RepID=A0AAN7TY39_9MYCE